jgi:hypothetical protein
MGTACRNLARPLTKTQLVRRSVHSVFGHRLSILSQRAGLAAGSSCKTPNVTGCSCRLLLLGLACHLPGLCCRFWRPVLAVATALQWTCAHVLSQVLSYTHQPLLWRTPCMQWDGSPIAAITHVALYPRAYPVVAYSLGAVCTSPLAIAFGVLQLVVDAPRIVGNGLVPHCCTMSFCSDHCFSTLCHYHHLDARACKQHGDVAYRK